MSDPLAPVLERLDQDAALAVARLCDLLRIPSVSTDPAFKPDCRRAAEWLAAELSAIGFDAAVRETPGHPMVVGHSRAHPEGAPRLLYYGHYDVQPADPIELWESPPFEPVVIEAERGPRVVGRGAVDDKGQVMTWLEALRAWHAVHGSYPARITVLLEGEEESGSPSLNGFLEANREELAADVCLISDTGMWDIDTPAITTSLRGMVYSEVTLHGPSRDLHSGMYGGAVPNPINVLARLIAQLHDEQGRIQIPGFYDGIAEPSAERLAQWRELGFDESAFLAEVGLKTPAGEAGRSALERLWSRPTCDVNGIHGGYTGKGAKTVIPAHATAKISCRLVPGQDPKTVEAGIRRFFEERAPADCRVELTVHSASPAIEVPDRSPELTAALRGLDRVFDKTPVLIGCGGSIPVAGAIRRLLGFDSLLIGFGLEDDRVHSPNEKFELRCLHNGARAHAAILAELGKPST
ncbi:dipeptidase [Marinivivus vitaminiproducens]|uniref:dipeptidase n=1 Tax=Marinivivus vitaminiproducens TaxID=3035935 RepID=UPI0027A0313E|nr:dipeptidase [Geminicoccaceae bacterium SCSIO 64248]